MTRSDVGDVLILAIAALKWLFARSLRNKLEKDLVDAQVMLTTES
jgi:hypothetical protein